MKPPAHPAADPLWVTDHATHVIYGDTRPDHTWDTLIRVRGGDVIVVTRYGLYERNITRVEMCPPEGPIVTFGWWTRRRWNRHWSDGAVYAQVHRHRRQAEPARP